MAINCRFMYSPMQKFPLVCSRLFSKEDVEIVPKGMSLHPFQFAIRDILNRWTCLKLAVDHHMGGRNSYDKAFLLVEFIDSIFERDPNIEWNDLEEAIIDFMEDSFNVSLEDGSSEDIAKTLVHLHTVYNGMGFVGVKEVLDALPPCQIWLDFMARSMPPTSNPIHDSDESSSDSDDGNDGTVDPEGNWVTVTYKRK